MQTKILVLFVHLPTDPVPEPYARVIYSNGKITNVPRAWKMMLHNINETQLKVANDVVGIVVRYHIVR